MKTHKKIPTITLVAIASILAPIASAQVAGAADAATRPTAATQNAELNAQQGAGAAGAANVNASRPMSDGIGVNGAANTHTGLNAQTNGLSDAKGVSGGAGSLNSAATVREIQGATESTGGNVLSQVDSSIHTSSSAMADLRRSGRQLKGEARTQFDAAYDDVRNQEKAVKRSLNEARKAKDSTWAQAQAQLASDYQAYSQAVSRAEVAAQGSAAASGSGSINR